MIHWFVLRSKSLQNYLAQPDTTISALLLSMLLLVVRLLGDRVTKVLFVC